jgi:DNA-binding NtrC family response regulator
VSSFSDLRILIAEDHPDYAFITQKRIFDKFGISADVVTSCEDAVQKLSSKKFNIVIANVELEDGSGDELFSYVETVPYDIRPIFLMFTADCTRIKTKDFTFKFLAIEKPNWELLEETVNFHLETILLKKRRME